MFEIMKLNKKYLSLVLMALVLIFSGCGEGEDDGKTGATTIASNADTTSPTGSIYINSTAQNNNTNTPSVTLNISASDASGVSQMCISNTTTCTAWETYAVSKAAWALPAGDGVKNVYVWFKDAIGNANATPYSGSITLDTTAPIDGTLTTTAVSGTIRLDWSGFSDNGSYIKDFTLAYSVGGGAAPASCSASAGTLVADFTPTWETGTSYTFTQTTGLTSGTTTYYRLCATDWAGNTSAGAVAQATP